MEQLCDVCGNEKPINAITCRYCGARKKVDEKRCNGSFLHKIVNIEQGRPFVEDALAKFNREINQARKENVAVLTIIHGYGSSGKGGAIRSECRKTLEYLESKNRIRGFIPGEIFSRKDGRTRSLLRRIPQLMRNSNLNRGNKGVTIVEL